MPRLTLEEIGRLAGVSRSTVSRVVNGSPAVSPEVQQRVTAVIERTGYRPNRAARSLVSSRSGLLGLVIPSAVSALFHDPYFSLLVQGITSAANAAEQTLSLYLFEDKAEALALYPRVIAGGLVDGLMITATTVNDPLVDALAGDATPFIMIGRPDADDVSHVDVDNREGARVATRHLLDTHGCVRIATVAAPSSTTTGVDRRCGFLDAAAEADVAVERGRVVEADFTRAGARDAARLLLDTDPDGIFGASDTMTLGVLDAIDEAGLRCPEDIAVVSFDGIADPHGREGFLTTVAQPVRETGQVAVRLLLDLLDGTVDGPARRVQTTQLRIGRSCGCIGDR